MYKIKLSKPHWFKANLVMRPIFSGKRCLSRAVSQPVVEYCEKIPGVVFFPILEKKKSLKYQVHITSFKCRFDFNKCYHIL